MPDRETESIRDLIYYQYAKIIAKRAFNRPDGVSVKGQHYGFVKTCFRDLKSGKKEWSEITREDWQLVESEKKCIYCGAEGDLSREHIVPKSLRIKPECSACDTIQGIHNQIWACKSCNSAKGTMGPYEFYQSKFPGDRKFYDRLPTLLEKKYLKTIFQCHGCAQTLGQKDINLDGEFNVLDIDSVLHR